MEDQGRRTVLLSEDGLDNLTSALDEKALVLSSHLTVEKIDELIVLVLSGPSCAADAALIQSTLEEECSEDE